MTIIESIGYRDGNAISPMVVNERYVRWVQEKPRVNNGIEPEPEFIYYDKNSQQYQSSAFPPIEHGLGDGIIQGGT